MLKVLAHIRAFSSVVWPQRSSLSDTRSCLHPNKCLHWLDQGNLPGIRSVSTFLSPSKSLYYLFVQNLPTGKFYMQADKMRMIPSVTENNKSHSRLCNLGRIIDSV